MRRQVMSLAIFTWAQRQTRRHWNSSVASQHKTAMYFGTGPYLSIPTRRFTGLYLCLARKSRNIGMGKKSISWQDSSVVPRIYRSVAQPPSEKGRTKEGVVSSDFSPSSTQRAGVAKPRRKASGEICSVGYYYRRLWFVSVEQNTPLTLPIRKSIVKKVLVTRIGSERRATYLTKSKPHGSQRTAIEDLGSHHYTPHVSRPGERQDVTERRDRSPAATQAAGTMQGTRR